MKIEVKVPAMGESVSEATIAVILKPSGSFVNVDEELVELETAKVSQVLYASHQGTILWNIKPGDTVKIGQVLGLIEGREGETVKKEEKTREPPKQQQHPSTSEFTVRETKEMFMANLAAKPEARPLSQPLQEGTPLKRERTETRKKMSTIRKVIAQRLVEAQQTMAMLTTFNEVDMSAIIGLREKYKESFSQTYGARLGFMSFFIKAVVSALKAFPELNSYISGEEIIHREYYDIGIAVGTEHGLIVPVVRDCDSLSFAEIETHIENYAKRAREKKLTADELQGGGFTITNGGIYGSLLSTPILNPPQSGILGMHKIAKRPVVIEDQIVIRPMMYVALSYDHRIVDGREAVLFLTHVKNALEDPTRLLLNV